MRSYLNKVSRNANVRSHFKIMFSALTFWIVNPKSENQSTNFDETRARFSFLRNFVSWSFLTFRCRWYFWSVTSVIWRPSETWPTRRPDSLPRRTASCSARPAQRPEKVSRSASIHTFCRALCHSLCNKHLTGKVTEQRRCHERSKLARFESNSHPSHYPYELC